MVIILRFAVETEEWMRAYVVFQAQQQLQQQQDPVLRGSSVRLDW